MHWPMTGQIHVCPTCDRKILVERALSDIDHTIETMVVCFDCLDDVTQKKAMKKYPLVVLPIKDD